jgi:hypothetical protein
VDKLLTTGSNLFCVTTPSNNEQKKNSRDTKIKNISPIYDHGFQK